MRSSIPLRLSVRRRSAIAIGILLASYNQKKPRVRRLHGATSKSATQGSFRDENAIPVPGGLGSAAGGVSGVGTIGADFGVAGNIPEPPGAYEEPVVIDVFSPVRADWRRLDPLAPKTPVWP